MSAPPADGILAIWHDCAAGREIELDAWYQGEHLAERLAVPGFLLGRRHEALSGSPRYFTFYLTETPDVLASAPYLARLNAPTTLTRRIMTGVFQNMIRTICRRAATLGRFRGSSIVTLRFPQEPARLLVQPLLEKLTEDPAVARAELWQAVQPESLAVAEEERLRGGDRRIAACLVIDALSESAADAIASELSGKFSRAETGIYRLLCEARRESDQSG
jgi:hypothetical protein